MDERTVTKAEIKELERELRYQQCRQNDEDFLFSDLTGLFVDIIDEISQTDRERSIIIYDYAKLLEQEIQHYSRIQSCFDEITGLLGDKRGLITDFTETYGKVHGMVSNHIPCFI